MNKPSPTRLQQAGARRAQLVDTALEVFAARASRATVKGPLRRRPPSRAASITTSARRKSCCRTPSSGTVSARDPPHHISRSRSTGGRGATRSGRGLAGMLDPNGKLVQLLLREARSNPLIAERIDPRPPRKPYGCLRSTSGSAWRRVSAAVPTTAGAPRGFTACWPPRGRDSTRAVPVRSHRQRHWRIRCMPGPPIATPAQRVQVDIGRLSPRDRLRKCWRTDSAADHESRQSVPHGRWWLAPARHSGTWRRR